MTAFLACLRHDVLTLWRSGFVAGALVATLVWIGLIRALPEQARPVALALVVFIDIALVGFFFLAGSFLKEREGGSLLALRVSPLPLGQYLASRLLVLGALAMLSGALVVLGAPPVPLAWPLLAAGIVATALPGMLAALCTAAWFRDFASFLVPSQLPALAIYLPLIPWIVAGPQWGIILLPAGGGFMLLLAAIGAAPACAATLLLIGLSVLFWSALLMALIAGMALPRLARAA